jgi:hypothetical protein
LGSLKINPKINVSRNGSINLPFKNMEIHIDEKHVFKIGKWDLELE